MKKVLSIITVCLVTTVTLSFYSCTAQAPKANLKTQLDSLSYALGLAQTQGLDSYLMQNGVDSALLKDFVAGFMEGAKRDSKDKKAAARVLGMNIGMNVAGNLDNVGLSIFEGDSTIRLNKDNVLAGFVAGALSKGSLMPIESAESYLVATKDKILDESLKTKYATEYAENTKFLEENKSKEGVQTTESGLQYKVLTEGKGEKPSSTDRVKVYYEGRLINDTIFDSTAKNGGDPFEFSLAGGVIQGWIEGVKLMPVGSKYTFYIPYNLAYGARGQGATIPPFATLVFDVELLEIVK